MSTPDDKPDASSTTTPVEQSSSTNGVSPKVEEEAAEAEGGTASGPEPKEEPESAPTPAPAPAQAPSSSSSAPVPASTMALCASCDRCRARKTKCDGNRPCGNCAAKYLKKNKLSSIEGIDISLFECVYSPAKRRGPVPGRVSQTRKSSEMSSSAPSEPSQCKGSSNPSAAAAGLNIQNLPSTLDSISANRSGSNPPDTSDLLQQHLENQKQQLAALGLSQEAAVQAAQAAQAQPMETENLLLQQRQQLLLNQSNLSALNLSNAANHHHHHHLDPQSLLAAQNLNIDNLSASQLAAQQQLSYLQQLQAQQQQLLSVNEAQPPTQRARIETKQPNKTLPKTILQHTPLLSKSSPDGNRLRSYYDLSVNELFNLPPIPTDEEYCSRLPVPIKPALLPRFDIAALQAARFAEVALGSLANNQVALALELSNATVMCLRECVEEPVHPSCMLDVARAYLLHGIFRSFRGDMDRYFKYRRVCLTHLSQLDNVPGVESLFAAMAVHDSWAYMVHNASAANLPQIDDVIPPLPPTKPISKNDKYGISTNPSSIASNPHNQMWIQGPPPIFINNKASPHARSLDALACAMRSCCDQANHQFENMSRQLDPNNAQPQTQQLTPTSSAVLANQNELCSRNMVLSAFTLLQLHEASSSSINKNHGHHLIISAMDAFLEGGDEEEPGGFTDSQIQSLLSVCNTVVEHPLLLHQGGPTYHMVSNAAILLCHLLNGMHAQSNDSGEMEAALFEEVLDTFITVRKLLNIHRRKLPVRLRCHGIPRPNFTSNPLVDLGETLMCSCRGCQGFVLMACSPCVAAERAQQAEMKREVMEARDGVGGDEDEDEEGNEFDKELHDLGVEFDLDDDALLNVLSRIITT